MLEVESITLNRKYDGYCDIRRDIFLIFLYLDNSLPAINTASRIDSYVVC